MATKISVKVYSTPSCPYCNMAKDFLKQHKISFENIDVSVNEKAAEHMIEVSGQMGVPVIEIGKEVIVGFDTPKLKKVLKIK